MIHEDYDENDHSKEGYAHLGLAVYYSQVLEHQLVNMIVLLKRYQGKIPTESDYEALFERKLSNTLGQLINEIKQLFQFQDDVVIELKKILKLRNFIVHDFFKEKIRLTLTRSGRDIMITELSEFVDRVRSMDARLSKYSNELQDKLGITDEMLEDEMKRLKKEILKESRG